MKIFLFLFIKIIFLTTQEYEYIKLQTEGIRYLDDKNWENALYQLKHTAEKYPSKGMPHLRIAELYQQKNLYSMSVPHLEKAKKLQTTLEKKEHITLYFCLANAYHHTKKTQQEKESLEKLLALTPSIADKQGLCYLGLGLLHLRIKKYEIANEYLLKAENLDYLPRKTHLALAKNFSKLAQTEKDRIKRQKYINSGRHYLHLYKESFAQKSETETETNNKKPIFPINTSELEALLQISSDKTPFLETIPNF